MKRLWDLIPGRTSFAHKPSDDKLDSSRLGANSDSSVKNQIMLLVFS